LDVTNPSTFLLILFSNFGHTQSFKINSDVKFCSFCLSPERCSLLSFQCYVSCCGYDQNMMQGRAVSEKHVAGGSALPGEKDLTLIVADEGWLHSRHLDTKLCSSPERIQGTWRDSVIRQQGCPMFSKKKAQVWTESATFSNKLLPQWHKDQTEASCLSSKCEYVGLTVVRWMLCAKC